MQVRGDERGAALLTVLLLVAAMSVLAVGVLEDIRFAVRRARNTETTGQAQWYALGAETLAKRRIGQLLARSPGRVTLEGDWSGKPLAFPVEHGLVQARITDRGACFNLNSVVIGTPDEPIADSAGIAQFAGLLQATGAASGEALRLAGALADWIDANDQPNLYGAEDEAYARLAQPYRTAGVLLAEESELRAVYGFTPDIYARVRPYVCALPQTGPSQVNINTLRPEDAPVLSALYPGRLSVAAARRIIEDRPPAGWPDQGAFLKQASLTDAANQGVEPAAQQISLTSRYFLLDADVAFADAQVAMSTLLEATPSEVVRTVARRWARAE